MTTKDQKKPAKIVQITAAAGGGDEDVVLYALDADGRVWRRGLDRSERWMWFVVPDVGRDS